MTLPIRRLSILSLLLPLITGGSAALASPSPAFPELVRSASRGAAVHHAETRDVARPGVRDAARASAPRASIGLAGFVENRGQVCDATGRPRPEVLFTADAGAARLFFTRNGVSHVLYETIVSAQGVSESRGVPESRGMADAGSAMQTRTRTWRVDVDFGATSPLFSVHADGFTGELRHSYLPQCPAGATDARVFSSLTYQDVRPGVDLVWYFTPEGLKYDVIVRAGGNLRQLRLDYRGATGITRGADGSLRVETPLGELTEEVPLAYVQRGGRTLPIDAGFVVKGSTVGFSALPQWDDDAEPPGTFPQSHTLIIDPCVHWSTYLGGATSDFGRDVAADGEGNIVFAGYTSSRDFPMGAGALGESLAGQIDVVIIKCAPDGRRLWSTFYGGSGSDEWPSVAVTPAGEVAVTGFTTSVNLPVTGEAMQPGYAGNTDGFVLKLDARGQRAWATYVGGSYSDEATDVVFDERGNVIVCGATYSTNFPASPGAVQTSNAGDFDAFILKLQGGGQRAWATYFGGWSMDYATGVTVARDGEVTITGHTEGEAFPLSPGADQSAYGGGTSDGFIARFSASGTRRWSTLYGGADEDKPSRVAMMRDGGVVVGGATKSRDLPLRQGAYQKVNAGVRDGFLVRYAANGTRVWDTYVGGNADDQVTALAVAQDGSISATGFTESPAFPVSADALQLTLGGAADAFIVRFDSTGMRTYGTFYGGQQSEIGNGIALDAAGNVTITGVTASSALAMFGQSAQRGLAGLDDAFMLRIIFGSVVADAGDNVVICSGASAKLGRDSGGGFGTVTCAWSPTDGLDDATSPHPIASPRQSTLYILTARDEAGCESRDTVAVTVLPPLTAEAGRDGDVCPGATFTLGRDPVGEEASYAFEWEPREGLSAWDVPRPQAAPARTTTYRLTVRNSYKCSAVDSVTVTVRDAPAITLPQQVMLCHGMPSALEPRVQGGAEPLAYLWQPAEGLSSATVASPLADPGRSMEYTLTVTDALGCTGSATTRVEYHPELEVDAGEAAVSCFGSPVKLSGRISGGRKPFAYRWSSTASPSEATTPSVMVQPHATTTYVLSVTDGNGCTRTDSVLVRVQNRIDVFAGEDVDVCEGAGAVVGREAQGGLAPYTYRWKPETGVSDPRIATPEIRPGSTRSYVLHVTDAAGCTGSDTIVLRVLTRPRISAGKDQMACAGTAVRLGGEAHEGTPPYTYAWTPVEGVRSPGSAITDIIPTSTQTYTLTVTDSRGCSADSRVTLTVENPPIVSAGHDTSVCIGEAIRLTATAAGGREPYRYEWSPADALSRPSSAAPDASPVQRTTFVVRVTDARGCVAVDSVVVDVYSKPRGEAGRDTTLCPGQSATLGARISGGRPPYRIAWTPHTSLDDPSILQPLAAPSSTTVYTLLATDANGCTFSDAVTVSVAPPLEVDAGPRQQHCAGGTGDVAAKVRGGIPPYRYSWHMGESIERGAQPRFSFTADRSMTIGVMVTDAAGCTAADSVFIEVPAPLSAAVEGAGSVCPGTEVLLTAGASGGVPPYQFTWSAVASGLAKNERAMSARARRRGAATSATSGGELRVKPMQSSAWILTVRDAAGCTASVEAAIAVHGIRPPAIAVQGSPTFCDGDSVQLIASEGYASYVWSDGGTGRIRMARTSATWSVRVTDAHGCESVAPSIETKKKERPRSEISVKGSTRLCAGSTVALDAGAGHAAYRWSTGATTRSITVGTAGTYTVEVQSKDGCRGISRPVVIDVMDPVTATLVQRGDTLEAGGGGTYRWFRDGRWDRSLVGSLIVPTRSGLYRVQVISESGCIAASTSIRVRVAPAIVPRTLNRAR